MNIEAARALVGKRVRVVAGDVKVEGVLFASEIVNHPVQDGSIHPFSTAWSVRPLDGSAGVDFYAPVKGIDIVPID
jgi:hypothetical protein